jgi:hypothetical protein
VLNIPVFRITDNTRHLDLVLCYLDTGTIRKISVEKGVK